MSVDVDLAAAVVPYVAAAVGVYGARVLERVSDAAADATAAATVGVGRRLLRRILGREASAGPVSAAVQDLAEDPTDEDRVAALRLQLRKALVSDPQLAAEVAAMLPDATTVTAAGPRSVAARDITGIVQTGDGSAAWQGRG
ncbi:hypothetical protein Daura_42095 [Dactylosporangium aurantiacum]|uniref:Uncharacterized protein n=1 Tax=Dactylosporangium aurantiacum TaxID=35754 RepID=A0A9Q9MMK7_9ACTN|nr:hypothetical protein Daura_42095 [Dactylosporangium aurantiacum]